MLEIGGPEKLSFRELMELVNEHTGNHTPAINIPYVAANFIGMFSRFFPKPIITNDQISMLKVHNIVENPSDIFQKLNISPTSIELIIPEYLKIYKNTA